MFLTLFFVMVCFSFLQCEESFSAPYRNGRFENLEPDDLDFGDFLKWILHRGKSDWSLGGDTGERNCVEIPERVFDSISVVFVGHSTFLIQVDGLNILTDPVWSERIGPVSFVGVKRVRPAGIAFDSLPKIDLVLISHNHYDHMDIPTLKRIEKRFSPLFIVGLGNKRTLVRAGIYNVVEMDWWQNYRFKDCIVHFVPARHFSGRGILDRNRSLWGGFVIESSKGKIYFAGDTGLGKFVHDIAERFNPIRLAFLPIGAYKPEWFMAPVHMSPDDAVKAHCILNPNISIAMHFGTFKLADDGFSEPVLELQRAIDDAKLTETKFLVPSLGEPIIIK